MPYEPKKFLKVNPKGVEENDFVFILGYPGRTFRHRPAQYIAYQQQFLLPYTSELYDFQNKQMELAGKDDKVTELALATRIKRNANVLKNYRGKLKGLRNIDLISSKKQEDEALATFINSKSELKTKYGTLMSDIADFYARTFEDAKKELWFNNIYSSTKLLQVARDINDFKAEMSKYKSTADQQKFFELNIAKVKQTIAGYYESYNMQVDETIAARMFTDAYQLNGSNAIQTVQNLKFSNQEQAGKYAIQLIKESKLNKEATLNKDILANAKSLLTYSDNLLIFQKSLDQELTTFGKEQQRRDGQLNKLMGDYVAVKEIYQSKNFIPDANSTLRLTFGNIKGYAPVDANYMKPFTTVKGILEKGNSDNPEFVYPEAIRTAWLSKNFGAYEKKDLKDVPVNILYNMDTTGGNSGSPIMNAYGELIGVNFDRSYDATINDFAWNESYSRSIGVDIRYVLWIADKIDNAQFIIKEMGI
ncbi:V8-like Glu-specific endopeptidase [Sphingobacterium spiritivorum]|uniref:V8-like Glu-specific endopeptidase n=1 Tax=Sphingobacterium spiritivorum TaxID=258 RepID=A0A380CST5_SPHSI|nr:V8-like Glu-specific endopeptidase [Sphingobacterium spiritivorum]